MSTLKKALKGSLRAREQDWLRNPTTVTHLWMIHSRQAEEWAEDIRRGLKPEWRNKAPDKDRGAFSIRTGFGAAVRRAIFNDPAEYWADMGLYRKTKAFWDKWSGGAAQELFGDSARGDQSTFSKWKRMVGY